jgi:hypothetical protein
MSPPVILAREGLPAFEILATLLGAMETLLLLMLVIDVPIKMRLGTKLLAAVRVRANMFSVVESLVVIQLVDLVKTSVAFFASKGAFL